jgi:hypothetical protein
MKNEAEKKKTGCVEQDLLHPAGIRQELEDFQ